MMSLRRILRGPEQSVRSLAVQAQEPVVTQKSTVFEVLTSHLLKRLVHNEALGEEIPTRVLQLAYMLALPGVLMALYLFAAYHQPRVIGPRPYWLQISDHYVYTVYAFIVMGAVTVFEWDLLFPDLLDVFILSVLPISHRSLLIARLLALTIFLTLALLGTNILGTLFFPAVADLHGMWWRHVFAHFTAIAMGGIFSAAFFVALQGGLLCLLGRRIFEWISPIVQAVSILVLLTIFFLTPLLCSHLHPLLESKVDAVRFFPPFWFLGLYEWLLWGARAKTLFVPLAETAVFATAGVLALAILTYPLAYARRTRQIIEGDTGTGMRWRNRAAGVIRPFLHASILRSPQQRAIFHFISQTLFRTSRLRLYLSIYAGVGISLSVSGLLLLNLHQGSIRFSIFPWGIRAVVPILAFLIPISLRTAFQAPVGIKGSWIFYVIHPEPLGEHLEAVQRWAVLYVGLITVAFTCGLSFIAPDELRNGLTMSTQFVMAVSLSFLLTEAFFLRFHHIPFTTARTPATTDLPVSFVRYVVLFPLFVLWFVGRESWIEESPGHLAATILLFLSICVMLRSVHNFYSVRNRTDPKSQEMVAGHLLGLQE